MTLNELDQLYSDSDKAVETAIASGGDNPPCKRGCFFCCKEPVYATSLEVQGILDTLSPEQKNDLSVKVSLWRDLFIKSGLHMHEDVPVLLYRTLNAWCPLLNTDGTCSVYSRRPFGCRLHIAKATPEKCEDDNQRLRQIYIYIPELNETINFRLWNGMRDGDTMVYDHLGLLLFEALHNEKTTTKSRMEVSVKGEDLIIKKHP